MNGAALPRTRVRLLILLVVAAALISVRPSSASCAPPDITVDKTRVAPGDPLQITGTAWAASCPEPRAEGCGGDDRSVVSPLTDIRVVLVPKGDTGGGEMELGTADADDDYTFRLDGVVPAETAPGRYRVNAGTGDHVNESPITIVVRRASR